MKEILSLHIGQAGAQIGNACWELLCHEHSIQPDGQFSLPDAANAEDAKKVNHILFEEGINSVYTPRAIYIDTDPVVIDKVKSGPYKKLFNPNSLISGKEDAGAFYSSGRAKGKKLMDSTLDVIRKLVERCDSFQGFMIYHSLGGGTGSGMASILLEKLAADYDKKCKLSFSMYSSPTMATGVLEVYNNVLATPFLLNYTDSTIVLDNEALYNISSNHLDNEKASYEDLNRLIAQLSSSINVSFRHNGPLNSSLQEFNINLIPYPRIHFMIPSYGPFIPQSKIYQKQPTLIGMTTSAFKSESMMLTCKPQEGACVTSCLMYRGNVDTGAVNQAIQSIKAQRTLTWVNWAPLSFKTFINPQSPTVVPDSGLAKVNKSVAALLNTSAITQLYARLNKKFQAMWRHKACLHTYFHEDFVDGEFEEAAEDLAALEKDFDESPEFFGDDGDDGDEAAEDLAALEKDFDESPEFFGDDGDDSDEEEEVE